MPTNTSPIGANNSKNESERKSLRFQQTLPVSRAEDSLSGTVNLGSSRLWNLHQVRSYWIVKMFSSETLLMSPASKFMRFIFSHKAQSRQTVLKKKLRPTFEGAETFI